VNGNTTDATTGAAARCTSHQFTLVFLVNSETLHREDLQHFTSVNTHYK
jgi:hypothetical protein